MFGFENKDRHMFVGLFKVQFGDRYLGSTIGKAWAIANPLLMLLIFTIVFGFVFKARLPGADTTLAYVAWMIGGYGPWLAFSEGLSVGTGSVVSNAALVKNIKFRTELLPISAVFVGMVPLGVSLLFLGILLVIDGTGLSFAVVYLPLVILSQFVFLLGCVLILSALNVFIRDISLVLPNLLLILMLTTPILYPSEMLPRVAQELTWYNPLFHMTDSYRTIFIGQQAPDSAGLLYLFAIGVGLLGSGLWFFRRLKLAFDSRL